jgi:hypothetical protein
MPIKNDEELRDIVETVSDGLAAIQDYLGVQSDPRGKIRFPREYIRPSSNAKAQL